eukprot:3940789-Rhodomonas_salina.3
MQLVSLLRTDIADRTWPGTDIACALLPVGGGEEEQTSGSDLRNQRRKTLCAVPSVPDICSRAFDLPVHESDTAIACCAARALRHVRDLCRY